MYKRDHNTKYFHGVIVVRRRRNKYDMLKDGNGNLVIDQEVLEIMAIDFYKVLYTKEAFFQPFVISNAFPKLGEVDREELRRLPSYDEIHQTMRGMGSLKALGLDGFRVVFFQHNWNIVGREFC